jgi:hypothetical protein
MLGRPVNVNFQSALSKAQGQGIFVPFEAAEVEAWTPDVPYSLPQEKSEESMALLGWKPHLVAGAYIEVDQKTFQAFKKLVADEFRKSDGENFTLGLSRASASPAGVLVKMWRREEPRASIGPTEGPYLVRGLA